jgi:hypothetical protein
MNSETKLNAAIAEKLGTAREELGIKYPDGRFSFGNTENYTSQKCANYQSQGMACELVTRTVSDEDYVHDANTRAEILASLTEEEKRQLIQLIWKHHMNTNPGTSESISSYMDELPLAVLSIDQPTFAKLFCAVKGSNPQSPTPSDAKVGRYELRRCRDGYFCGTMSLIYCDGKEVFGPRQLYPSNSVGPDKIEQHAQTIFDALNKAKELEAELAEWKQICKNRDATVKAQGEEWARLKTEIDSLKSSHNEAVKAVEFLNKWGVRLLNLPVGTTHNPNFFKDLRSLLATNTQERDSLKCCQ